jgi:molybdopterin synthase sulfur carrier subunit
MMEIEIISFGKIAEFVANQRMKVMEVNDTDQLAQYLERLFPALATMKYKLALNKSIVQENTKLQDNDAVAIMPPFSGG